MPLTEGLKRLKRLNQPNSTRPKAEGKGLKRLRVSRDSTFQPSHRWAGRYEFTKGPTWNGEWMNFRVKTEGSDGERNYSFGWNGHRLARGFDLARAEFIYPEFLESFTDWLEAGCP